MQSAFGDDFENDTTTVPAPGSVAAQPPAPRPPAVSAFGDSLDDEPSVPTAPASAPAAAPVGGIAGHMQNAIPGRTAGQWATDAGVHLGRGVYGLFDSLAGLGDLASGGAVTPWLVAQGLDSQKARQQLDAELSPQARAAEREVADAQGFVDTAGAVLKNPDYLAGAVIESVPQMVAGSVAGRGIAAGARLAGVTPGLAGTLGVAGGEGTLGAGQVAQQTTRQTGELTPGQAGLAVGSGLMTGLLGVAGARVGRKLGVADIDAQLAGQNGADVAKGFVNRALVGTGVESIEELSQSAQQQVLTNLATDRPAMEGVEKQAAMGAVVGGAMGGAAGLRRPTIREIESSKQPQVDPTIGAARAAVPGAIRNYLNPEPAQTVAVPEAPAQAPQPTPFAGSVDINPLLDNLQLDGDRRSQAMDLLRPVEQDIEARRRGVVTEAEQTRLANLIGLDGSQALAHGRKLGETFNAEQFRAVTSAVQAQMTSVLDLQQKIVSGQATDLDRAQFMEDLTNMRHTTGELLGARAEAGRALAAQRRQVADIKQAQAILESTGGRDNADDLAAALGEAIRSGGLQNAARVMQKGNHITDYIKAGWLYDPTTHIANMAGNTGMIGVNLLDRTNAAILAGAKRMFGLKGETTWSEPVALLSGAIRGQAKAVAASGRAFTQGESPLLGSGKLENSSLPQRTMPGKLGTAKLAFDNVALGSFRALGAEDAYYAITSYEAELRAQAHRIAAQEKRDGALPQGVKLSGRIEQLVDNPTPAMIETAGNMARESTFNGQAGPLVSKVLAAKSALPWLNVLIPFIKTPSAIVKRAVKSSPAGLLAPSTWRDMKAGGAASEMAIARVLTGTQIMIGAGLLAQAGYLTGSGPSDDKERKAWLAAGNQPFSVKVGDSWYGINRLDPFAMWASMAADLVNMDWRSKSAEDSALELVSSFTNNVSNKTWFSGIQRLSMALADPQRYLPTFAKQTAASVLQPNALVANIASRQDPYVRQPETMADTLANRVPGLRDDLPARLDDWGEPLANSRQGDTVLHSMLPMTHVEESKDPLRIEAARLGWTPGRQQDFLTSGKRKYPLSPEQIAERNAVVGQLLRRDAAVLMRSPAWKGMDDDQRRAALGKLRDTARAAVKVAMVPLVTSGKRGPLDRLKSNLQQREARR